jgi:hypothetical protein
MPGRFLRVAPADCEPYDVDLTVSLDAVAEAVLYMRGVVGIPAGGVRLDDACEDSETPPGLRFTADGNTVVVTLAGDWSPDEQWRLYDAFFAARITPPLD